jgi:GTP-binding protein
MNITSAEFVCSNSEYKKCPDTGLPEFAFIGRSNVGKSSLINSLTGKKGLAKTSSTPGKTQLINHFIINESWYLVDLPGYGYAKVSQTERLKWEKMINDYLMNRGKLFCTFVLVDSRLEPQLIDIEFINYLGESGIPFAIIFTKTDKLTKNELSKSLAQYKKKLLDWWEELPPLFVTSAEKGNGKEEVLEYIGEIMANAE